MRYLKPHSLDLHLTVLDAVAVFKHIKVIKHADEELLRTDFFTHDCKQKRKKKKKEKKKKKKKPEGENEKEEITARRELIKF